MFVLSIHSRNCFDLCQDKKRMKVGVWVQSDYYGIYYHPDFSYGPKPILLLPSALLLLSTLQSLFLRRLASLASSRTLACE